jgi:SAM-dependent methyltransferase
MSLNLSEFAHQGKSWAERASHDELSSVLYVNGSERVNLLMHGSTLAAAKAALALRRRPGMLLDFGCGVGRMLRFFGARGWCVAGTEITAEMLAKARQIGVPERCQLHLTNGVSIPLPDESVDLIWVSGVLKYALLHPSSKSRGGTEPDHVGTRTDIVPSETSHEQPFIPVYENVAKEMYRVLKRGGFVINVEMWVDARPELFTAAFERVGFTTKRIAVLRRYEGWLERLCQWREWHAFPPAAVVAAGELIGRLRLYFDNPCRRGGGMRDYLFVWAK